VSAYDELRTELKAVPKTWLGTGVVGFIGSNLLAALRKLYQQVAGFDDFSTGDKKDLVGVKALVSPARWPRFRFQEGDIGDLAVQCH
jgi:UDP-N-acetylglucosamine 4-epimerase